VEDGFRFAAVVFVSRSSWVRRSLLIVAWRSSAGRRVALSLFVATLKKCRVTTSENNRPLPSLWICQFPCGWDLKLNQLQVSFHPSTCPRIRSPTLSPAYMSLLSTWSRALALRTVCYFGPVAEYSAFYTCSRHITSYIYIHSLALRSFCRSILWFCELP
jgi:hypothetical protein